MNRRDLWLGLIALGISASLAAWVSGVASSAGGTVILALVVGAAVPVVVFYHGRRPAGNASLVRHYRVFVVVFVALFLLQIVVDPPPLVSRTVYGFVAAFGLAVVSALALVRWDVDRAVADRLTRCD